MTPMDAETYLRKVCFFHIDLMVSKMKIYFSEELVSMKLFQEIDNDRNKKFIFDSQLIGSLKTWTNVPSAFLFNTHNHQ